MIIKKRVSLIDRFLIFFTNSAFFFHLGVDIMQKIYIANIMPSLSCFSEVVLVKKRVPDRWNHIVGGLENDRSSPGIFIDNSGGDVF